MMIVLLSGCTGSQDITPVVKALPEVQQFLNEHPNAKITVTYWSKEDIIKISQEISQQCDRPITPVPMYKATISEGDLKIVSWINAENQILICSVTEGKGGSITPTVTSTPIVTQTPVPTIPSPTITIPSITPTITATSTLTPAPTPTATSEVTPAGNTIKVRINRDRGFINPNQKNLAIKPGDEVIWVNDDIYSLTLISKEGLFEDKLLGNGIQISYLFNKTGTYNFDILVLGVKKFSGTVAVEP